MSEPIAIQAPQPSSVGASRIGTAGFAIGIAIVALVVAAAVAVAVGIRSFRGHAGRLAAQAEAAFPDTD